MTLTNGDTSNPKEVGFSGIDSPIRAILFSPDGKYYSLWLSPSMEGHAVFTDQYKKTALPFYVEKVDGAWYVFCTDGARFYTIGSDNRKIDRGVKIRLSDSLRICAEYKDETYRVYSEVEKEGDYAFLPYYLEPWYEDYTIGRNPDNVICYSNPSVSRNHAVLHWNKRHWEIIDRNSTNGTYVNNQQVDRKELHLGDVVYIMGLFIVMGAGYIVMNNKNNRVRINSPHIRPIPEVKENFIKFREIPTTKAEEKLFDRPPRKMVKVEAKEIEIEMPPMKMGNSKIPLALRLGTPAIMGGQALLSGNYLMALTSMVMPALNQGFTEKDRKEYEAKRLEKYREYLVQKQEEIEKEVKQETVLLNKAHPALSAVCSLAKEKKRLWERRKVNSDFLNIRIGTGTIPMLAERRFNEKKFELEEDVLEDEMYALAEKPFSLEQAPITLSLKDDFIVGAQGDRQRIPDLVRNMILQLAVTHSYDELKICVLTDPDNAEQLEFAKYLPHTWDDERSIRFFAESQEDTIPIAKYFKTVEEKLFTDDNIALKNNLSKEPAFLIFALNKKLFESLEVLKTVISKETYHGISVFTAFEGVPKECRKIIDVHDRISLVDLEKPEEEEQVFTLDRFDRILGKESLDVLYHTKLKTNSELFSLPSMVSFLEMYQAGKVEHLNPMNRWAENNPVKSLAVPVGVGTDGNLFMLDLHEKRQGPHGLIAGMTGSGKSEFIITYILSMAVNFSPEEVAFILIDYKGGGLTDAFDDKSRGIHLPHLVGTITNLDGASINRSLMSINSELKRRQAVFKKAKSETNEGTMDIYDYQKLYRNKKVKEPMPHLFIISDEFAELKKQQPEFMDELISTARIGRSLGVHLILATQKPGGVVNDQIWSNTKFRVSLKVQDRADSMEMLKRPEAAELKHTGRFYLQVGYNEYFALGQSAWCGAGYFPQDKVAVEEDRSVRFVDTSGQILLRAKPRKEARKAECKQIVAIVNYLSDLAVREKIKTKNLWKDPLPMKLEYRNVLQEINDNQSAESEEQEHITAIIGEVDDPEYQTQYPMTLDLQSFHHMLMCGSAGSGKTTFLRTLLYSLITRYTPEDVNYYILDLSSGGLSAYANTPFCGAYLTEENESDFDRMLKLIKELTTERKQLFAEAEVFGFESYRQIKKLPLILVVIDGWTNISTFRKAQEYGLVINEYMREAANCGIRFIFTLNHINDISMKAKQEIDYRIVLRAKDKFDYNDILNVRGANVPPEGAGRGVCVIDGRPLEYQVAVPNCMEDDREQSARLKKELESISASMEKIVPARKMPMLEEGEKYSEFCMKFDLGRIPLGYSMKDMQKVAMPLQQLYDMSIFFGNPIGRTPVLMNLLFAFYRENADVIIMRRNSDTVFDRNLEDKLKSVFESRVSFLNTTEEDVAVLDDMIVNNIRETKMQHRNAFCEEHGIPDTDRGRTKKASRYIREHSHPLFVLFESFVDLLHLNLDDNTKTEFSTLFGQIQGYNVYFFGCFYPEDEKVISHPMLNAFIKKDNAMLFGGQFQTEWVTQILSDYKKMEKINPNYNRFILKYRNECHRMVMPCGELITSAEDPDEAEIL